MPIKAENRQSRFLNAAAREARKRPGYPTRLCDNCSAPFAPFRTKNVRFCSTQMQVEMWEAAK